MTLTFLPILRPWLIALVAAALVALLAYGSVILRRKNVPGRWIGYLGALRVLAILVFVMCLLRPVLSYRAQEQKKPDVLVLLDTSKSMATVSGTGSTTRLQQSIESLRSSGLLASLESGANVNWFAFDGDARPVSGNDVAQLNTAGDSTHFADSLATAWQYHQSANSDLAAGQNIPARVIVVSDGNDDSGSRDAIDEARKLGQPIYTLPAADVADPDQAKGIFIATVQAPQRVLSGSETRFRAVIGRSPNDTAAPASLVVTLLEEGQTIATQELTLGAKQTEGTVQFTHRPAEPGARHFVVKVDSTNDSGASTRSAKPYETSVDVVGRNNQVLVLDDSWRWEFKFLRRVFEDDPNFSFTAFLPRTPGIHMQFAEPDRTARLSSFPQSRAELEFFDVIVLGDVQPQRWPRALAEAIYQGVAEKGKSLIIIAGPNLGQLADNPQLAALLPVEVSNDSGHPIAGPVRVQPTLEGLASPLFYSPPDAAQTVAWGQLPEMDQVYPVVRKKPAATILLEAPEHANSYGNVIVMAEQTVGKGRVLFVATDTLWKWQTLTHPNDAGNTPYQIFWQQALRTLAPDRWSGEAASLWMRTDQTRYTAGQSVRLTVEMDADSAVEHPQMTAVVTLPDGKEFPLMLTGDAARPGLFHADFETTQPGRYKVAAALLSDNKQAGDVASNIDVEPTTGETSRLATNHAFLQRLASATGGQVIDTANRATWPTFAAADTVSFEQTKSADLWSNFNLVLVLLAVLGLDWLLRLLRGFV